MSVLIPIVQTNTLPKIKTYHDLNFNTQQS